MTSTSLLGNPWVAELKSNLAVWCSLAPIFIGVLLLLWRIWTFTLVPVLHPKDPPQLPYWLPFLGHAVQFAKNSEKVFLRGRRRFGKMRNPYSITLAGKTFYVLTDPQDFTEIYKSPTIFSFDFLVQQVYRAFEVPEKSIQKLYEPQDPDSKVGYPNPLNKSSVNLGHEMLVAELRGKKSHAFATKVKYQLDRIMGLDQIAERLTSCKVENENELAVSLFSFCSVMVISAGQNAYFGDRLSQIDFYLPEAFVEFDKNCWQMFYGYPLFLSKPMTTPKAKLISALTKFLNIPIEERDGMSWFVKSWEEETRRVGLPVHEIATIMLIQYFGLNTNTPKAAFWLLAYVIFNPGLAEIFREETESAFKSGVFDYSPIENSARMNGIWFEALRLSTSSVSFRAVTQDYTLKGMTLRKGNQILLNPRLFHLDEKYFGSSSLEFDETRFMNNTLGRSPAFRPFGGGEPICPGRTMAKQTTITFVAYALHRFDFRLETPQPFPRPSQEGNPGVGIMAPVAGDDLIVRITKRGKA